MFGGRIRLAFCLRGFFSAALVFLMKLPRLCLLPALLFFAAAGAADPVHARPLPVDGPLVFEEKDTVVLLGDGFFDREVNFGHLETALTLATAGKEVKFRNLGWTGDTPRCESRSYFGPPEEGFQRLRKHLEEIKPTVVLACYGSVDAFNGKAGLPDFLKAYNRLLDMIRDATGAGVVLISPPPVETLPPPFPNLEGQTRNLKLYSEAIAALAKERGLRFADLFGELSKTGVKTVNGVNLTPEGYAAAAPAFLKALNVPESSATASGELRDLINNKNRLFFHRWRPQNEIYIFGARKHEQGNNAVEIPLFDPLVEKEEEKIAALLKTLTPPSETAAPEAPKE